MSNAGGNVLGGYGKWKTTNSGANWTGLRTDIVKKILLHPSYPNSTDNLFIIGNGGSNIYQTTNGGNSWTDITNGLPSPITLNDLQGPPNAGLICVSTDKGVYKYDFPPAAPSGFNGENYNGNPRIYWNPAPEADLQAYEVHRYFTITNQNTTSYIDQSQTIMSPCSAGGLPPRQAKYYIVIKDQGGLSSSPSTTYTCVVRGGMGTEKTAIKNEDFGERKGEPLQFSLSANFPNPFNPKYENNLFITK